MIGFSNGLFFAPGSLATQITCIMIVAFAYLLINALLYHGVASEPEKVTLTFINASPEPVKVYWVGEDGKEELVSEELEPGYSNDIETETGHTFKYSSFGESQWSHDVTVSSDTTQNVVVGGEKDEVYVKCQSTKGSLNIVVKPNWSPRGAGRFLQLVKIGFFDGCALNRVVEGFLVQFGIGATFESREEWGEATILDDDPQILEEIDFQKGYMSYAGAGPNTRTTEMFIVRNDTPKNQLEYFGENPWETPFGYVKDDGSLDVVSEWYAYGDMPPWGEGPDSSLIYPEDGYEYLKTNFPKLDYLKGCEIVDGSLFAEEEEEL